MQRVDVLAQPEVVPADRFEDLFVRLYPGLYSLAYGVLGEREDAEDVLQESFLRLDGAAVLQRPDGEVAAWLRRVCLHLAFNRRRDRRRARERLERAGRLDAAAPGDQEESDPSVAVVRREEQEEVRRALATLPERQRNCLLLRHAGYSYAEIAATLGIAAGSVGVLLARAERAFRDVYQRHQEHDDALS